MTSTEWCQIPHRGKTVTCTNLCFRTLSNKICLALFFQKISAISATKAMNIPTTSTMYTPSMLIIPMRFRDSAERNVGSRQLENSLLPPLLKLQGEGGEFFRELKKARRAKLKRGSDECKLVTDHYKRVGRAKRSFKLKEEEKNQRKNSESKRILYGKRTLS